MVRFAPTLVGCLSFLSLCGKTQANGVRCGMVSLFATN